MRKMVVVLCLVLSTWVWLSGRGLSQISSLPQQCFFIFGDSLVDNGILTLARAANYRPYGVNFPLGPTGRFTDVELLLMLWLMGFPNYIPPYSRTRGPQLLRGVNYASGAAGIREETSSNLGGHTSMNEQVTNFANIVRELSRFFRGDNALMNSYLSKCVFFPGMGSNDYLNNYFMPEFYTSSDYTARAFANVLLQDYSRQLTQLYSLGAHKVIVTAVGQIGCIPYQLARFHSNNNRSRCNDKINTAISFFNSGLRRLVQTFNNG